MPNVQNNFNALNGGGFADKQINNVPAKNPVDAVLSNVTNQGKTSIRSTGNFNSKVVTQ